MCLQHEENIMVYRPVARQRPRNQRENSRYYAMARQTRPYNNKATGGNDVCYSVRAKGL
jgi:hypothetical protein